MVKALFIVAQEGYQEVEYGIPKEILESGGVTVITASKEAGICKSKSGGTITAAISLSKVNVSDYVAVIFIGGPGAIDYQHDKQAHLIAQEAINKGKIIGAICIAPTILAYAGILVGKKATVWNADSQQQKVLEKNKAIYTEENVTVDGMIITANGPPAADKFGKKILEMILKQK